MYSGFYGNGWFGAALIVLLAGLFLAGGRRPRWSGDRQRLSESCRLVECPVRPETEESDGH